MTARRRGLRALALTGGACLALSAAPAIAADAERTTCKSRISGNGFWNSLSVHGVTCVRGAEIARTWVRRYGPGIAKGRRPVNPQKVDHWTCRLSVLQGEYAAYGRVICKRGDASLRFVGTS